MNMAIMAELIRKPKQNILRTSGNPPRRVCSTRCRNFAIWSLVLEATWNPQIQPGNDQEMIRKWCEQKLQSRKLMGIHWDSGHIYHILTLFFMIVLTRYWHRIEYLMTTWSAWIVRAWEGRCPGRISIGRIWVGLTAEGPGIAVASELLHFQLRNQRLMSTGVDQCRLVTFTLVPLVPFIYASSKYHSIIFNLCMSHWMPLSINAPPSLTLRQ